MDIKLKAREFATMAHERQVRKATPEIAYINHPIEVAKIIEEYGYDDNMIAAGYLHDVVEDTKYEIEDIKELFGEDVADLVNTVTEQNKEDSWENRKQQIINDIKNKSLRNKIVACSDKINNIECIIKLVKEKGIYTFKSFKRGPEKQLWYYNNIYNRIIYNEDKNLPIFKRLKKDIEILESEITKINV